MSTFKPTLYFGHPLTQVKGEPTWNTNELYPINLTSHAVTVASSGGGKSTMALIPTLLTWRGSAVVLDPFGAVTYQTAAWRATNVGPVRILDPWNEIDRQYLQRAAVKFKGTPDADPFPAEWFATYNPLEGIDPESDEYHDDLSGVVAAVIETISRDVYWDRGAEQLCRGLATWAHMTGRPDWGEVRRLVTLPFPQLHDEVIAKAAAHGGYVGRQLGRYLLAKPEPTNEMLSVLSNAIEQTNFLESKRIKASLATSTFDFSELAGDKPTTVYVVLPPDKFEGLGRKWLRLILQSALRDVMRLRPKNRVLFAIDEFGTIGKLREIETAFGLARGSGVALWIFLQSIGQIKTAYKDNWQSFMANADAVQYFNIKDYETAAHIARETGHYYHMGWSVSHGPGGDSSSEKEELRAVKRPEDIMLETQRYMMVKHLQPNSDAIFKLLGFSHYYNIPELKARARRHPQFDA